MLVLCKQEVFTKINTSVGSVLEFQQHEPQNQQKIVTLMNNAPVKVNPPPQPGP